MSVGTEAPPSWHDPYWRERGDNAWRAGLRLQQAWWREERLKMPPGPIRKSGGRPVVSMLPLDVGHRPNLMTPEAESSAIQAKRLLHDERRPGLIQDDRLKRNLLSSQPLCFNLFGHLTESQGALLPWVQSLVPAATAVTEVRLEWAPAAGTLGGSAFDAFVEFALDKGNTRGFLGIECKYAEDLKESQRKLAAEKYLKATQAAGWPPGAAPALDVHGLRQLWYNQLLTQVVSKSNSYEVGLGVVVACQADMSAQQAVDEVKTRLTDPETLVFSSLESVVATVKGEDKWRREFNERYLDFTPIQDLLPAGDPRQIG